MGSEDTLMYFDATATGRRIQKLRRTRKITQEQLAIELRAYPQIKICEPKYTYARQ